MTMTEGMVRSDALSEDGGRLRLAVHLPWYRSLPVSCLESVEVTVVKRRAAASVALPLPAATSRTSSSQRISHASASCSPTICRVVPMTA